MKNTQGQFFYLPLRCKCCIRSRCHSFMHCSISFRGKNPASAFPPQLPLLQGAIFFIRTGRKPV